MLGLFKKKSAVDKLNAEYKKLLSEAHQLSTTNRTLSDGKMAEANAILEKIELLSKKSQ